jgi:hypothetical protein
MSNHWSPPSSTHSPKAWSRLVGSLRIGGDDRHGGTLNLIRATRTSQY